MKPIESAECHQPDPFLSGGVCRQDWCGGCVILTVFFFPKGDLPPILRAVIESVGSHLKWCEHMLQNAHHISPEVRENLHRQKSNLEQQMRLVNDQIYLHRVSPHN